MSALNILVTDGDNRAALAIVRSLGRRHRVTVGAARHPTLASVSRFCHARLSYPDPAAYEAEFVDTLARAVTERGIDMLIPVSDIATLTIAEHRDRFACRLPLPSTEALQLAANKATTLTLAQQLGIATPRMRIVEHPRDRGRVLTPDDTFPLVLKPARSRIRVASGWAATAVRFAANPNELAQALAELPREAYPLIVQERIHGPGVGVFACYDRGRCIALFSHRRLREKPPSGGVSVLCESAPLDPKAVQDATRLLDRIGWHGVAMVEFKRDERDGVPKLMEINGRFWGSLQLAIDAGVDFPALVTELGGNDPAPVVDGYRLGVRSRWLWGDADALLTLCFNARERARLAPTQRARGAALHAFAREFFEAHTRQEVLRASDPRPGWLETKRWLLRR